MRDGASKVTLPAFYGCVVDDCRDHAVRVDRYVKGLVNEQIVIGANSYNFEVVDEREFGCPISDWERLLLLGHPSGLVFVTGNKARTYGPLGLKVDFQGYAVVVDGDMILDVESAFEQHRFPCPAIGARNESDLCERDEIVGSYGESLRKRRSCESERQERYR
jgi:hypothetical protein